MFKKIHYRVKLEGEISHLSHLSGVGACLMIKEAARRGALQFFQSGASFRIVINELVP